MSQLRLQPVRPAPEGERVKLSEVLQLVRGVTYKKENSSSEPFLGSIPLLRANNINETLSFHDLVYVPLSDVSQVQKLQKGDVVIAASSGSLSVVGKAAQLTVDWNGSFGAFCYGLRPNEKIDPRYLHWFLQTSEYRNQVSSLAAGVNINNLKREHVSNIEIPLPNMERQANAVAEIEKQFSRLDAGIAALKRAQANLKRYRASVLKAAVDGQLVQHELSLKDEPNFLEEILADRKRRWIGKYKEPSLPSTHAVPNGWKWVNLGHVCWSVKDGPHFSPKYVEEGIPFISGGNVRPHGVDFASAKRISPELHAELSKRCKPEIGDVLYTKGGTTGVARVNTYDIDFNVWVHVAVLKICSGVSPEYVQHALNSPDCYRQAKNFTHGVGNQDLGLTRMVNIEFGLPPFSEQVRIVAEMERLLSVADSVEANIDQQLARATRLRQAILAKAFSEDH